MRSAGLSVDRRRTFVRYALAVGVVAAAAALRLLPAHLGTARPFLLLDGAVVVTACYGGRGPALVATVLATLIAAWSLAIEGGSHPSAAGAAADLGVFVAECAFLASVTVAMTESRARAQDSADRSRRKEEQLRKLNKAHRALSISTEALVCAEDEGVLLSAICRAIVDVAGYRMCWVGRAEHDAERTVRPIARAGYDEGYVDQAEVTWSDTARGQGPVGTAIRTRRPCVPTDVARDAAFTPWRAAALARGYASMIALPLRLDGQVFGALAIYATEEHAFDADAVKLLTDLSYDLAYGITALRARAALAEEHARFETTLMQAPIAVAVLAGPDHVVRLANRRWLALGLGPECVGRPLRESLPEAARAGRLAHLDAAYATGSPREILEDPIPRARPDGCVETRFYNVAIQPCRSADGLVTDLVVTVNDVTAQVEARRVVEEAQAAAEQANRAKDEFLRLVSHELRTPLTSILGFAEALGKSPACDPRKLARGLEVILCNARAEARIVDDLIDVSNIVAGAMRVEARDVELAPLVRACVDEARPAAEAKGLRLDAALADDTPLQGDPGLLAQAARRLLSNALKFTPQGGRVVVEVARQDGALTLRVRDTGVGIPPSELPHVFELFRTGDASLKRAHGGLGLGLYVVRYIVEAHGGTVWAESDGPGLGATLVVRLPARA